MADKRCLESRVAPSILKALTVMHIPSSSGVTGDTGGALSSGGGARRLRR
ncbi:MAG: hypothetical protein LBO64_08585 [Desulfovibrio sp.]|nr:hypothetical protein [Desulfovibrio sp.]